MVRRVLAVLVIWSAGLCAYGAEIVSYGRAGRADLPAATVLIINNSAARIRFGLSLNNRDWKGFELAPGYDGLYGPDEQVDALFIRVGTDDNWVRYKLQFDRRYQIVWRGDRKRWDVETLGPR